MQNLIKVLVKDDDGNDDDDDDDARGVDTKDIPLTRVNINRQTYKLVNSRIRSFNN